MTISEIIKRLGEERDLGSRFPARIIFVDNLALYSELVKQLKSVCDMTINIADFGKKDVVPQFDKIRECLSHYEGKQILLLSVGEYLRLCIKRELNNQRAQFPSFWESMQRESSKTRYIMPMFACRDCFERIVSGVDERQESFMWNLKEPEVRGRAAEKQQYNIAVYSPKFANTVNSNANNLEEWLRNWQDIISTNNCCSVVTNQCHNAEASCGAINICTIDNPFGYLCNLLSDADRIDKSWESDDFWVHLIASVNERKTFSDVVLEQLGITQFDFVSVIARWDTLDAFHRELVWLWYRVYPTDEYYSYACKKAKKATEIPEKIRDEILEIVSRSENWINERMQAMQVLKFDSFSEEYFKNLDKLPVAETKLQLLTYKTHEERKFAIKTVSEMLRKGVKPQAIAEILESSYPVLATYLNKPSEIDPEIDEYLSWYRTNKLINRFPGNYARLITYDRFDTRFKQLNKLSGKDYFTLWIDGFGVEWLPVFLKELERIGIKPESKNIATAILPTETEYNHQWEANNCSYLKWNKLDVCSHRGLPDDKSYFSCIAYQLGVFPEAAKKVNELLNEHEYVAITGDHGSSRLAALAFHDVNIASVTAPKDAKVRSFGRFCELPDSGSNFNELDFMEKIFKDDKIYVVMRNYNHFSVSGNAAGGNTEGEDRIGEIHGGDTPEERLVPVVVVRRPKPLCEIICKPKNQLVFKKHGNVEILLEFNRSISKLDVFANSIKGVCTQNDGNVWMVSLNNVSDDILLLTVIADEMLLSEKISIKVKSIGIEKSAVWGDLL